MAATMNVPASKPVIQVEHMTCGACGLVRAATGLRGAGCSRAVCDSCMRGQATSALVKDPASRANAAWCPCRGCDKGCFTLPASVASVVDWHAALPRDEALEVATSRAAAAVPRCQLRADCKEPATRVCAACSFIKLCDACWRELHRPEYPVLASHKPQSLAEAGSDVTDLCTTHRMPRLWFCETDATLKCVECRDQCTKTGHKVEHIGDKRAALVARLDKAATDLTAARDKATADMALTADLTTALVEAEASTLATIGRHRQALIDAANGVCDAAVARVRDELAWRRTQLHARGRGADQTVAFSRSLTDAAKGVVSAVSAGTVNLTQLADAAAAIPMACATIEDSEKSFQVPPSHRYLTVEDSSVSSTLAAIRSVLSVVTIPVSASAISAPDCKIVKVTEADAGALVSAAGASGAVVGGAAAGAAATGAIVYDADGGTLVFRPQACVTRVTWGAAAKPSSLPPEWGAAATMLYTVVVDGRPLCLTSKTSAELPLVRVTPDKLAFDIQVVPSLGPYRLPSSAVVTVRLQAVTVRLWGAGGAGGSVGGVGGAGGFTEATVHLPQGETLKVVVGSGGTVGGAASGKGGGGQGQRDSASSGEFSGGGGGASYVFAAAYGGEVMVGAGGGGGGAASTTEGQPGLGGGGGGGTHRGLVGAGGFGATGDRDATAGSNGAGGGGGNDNRVAGAGGGAGGNVAPGESTHGSGGAAAIVVGDGGAGGGGGGTCSMKHAATGSVRTICAAGSKPVTVPAEPAITTAGQGGDIGAPGKDGCAIIILPSGRRMEWTSAGEYDVVV